MTLGATMTVVDLYSAMAWFWLFKVRKK